MQRDRDIGRYLSGRAGQMRPSRRNLLKEAVYWGGGILFTGVLFREVAKNSQKPTLEQAKAAFLLSEKNAQYLENIKVVGEKERDRVIPANLRNRPATEAGSGEQDSYTGSVIAKLKPGTIIPQARVVWGKYTTDVGLRTDDRWLAVKLADGQIGYLHHRGVDIPANFYQLTPVDLKTVTLASK